MPLEGFPIRICVQGEYLDHKNMLYFVKQDNNVQHNSSVVYFVSC